MREDNSSYIRKQFENEFKPKNIRNGISHERINSKYGYWRYRDLSNGRFLPKREGLLRFIDVSKTF